MTHSLKVTPKPYVRSSEVPYIREPNSHLEFSCLLPYANGLGLDIGCGSNRFSDTVLTCDINGEGDVFWGPFYGPSPFREETFDFIIASHVLEDFDPEHIQQAFDLMMGLLKPKGYLCLLVPDMEGKRYPDVDDKWTWDDELVQKGERNPGDCRGNSSHRITMGVKCLFKLTENYPGALSVVQYDTLPKDQMTMDFVIQRL